MKRCTANFIEESRKIHGDKYDYSKVEYVNCDTKVCIICPEHGEFWQKASHHLHDGTGCPVCAHNESARKKRSTTKDWIEKARKIHGNKYDYSKVDYVKNSVKVCIICPEHGEFWQTPSSHLNGSGCPMCTREEKAKKRRFTQEDWIKKAREIHGDKYDYSKVEYINSRTDVCIICPEHGEFWQRANQHLQGCGCRKCADKLRGDNQRFTTDEFIEKSRKLHGNKYDYSKVNYVANNIKVCITCPEHGDFIILPYAHMNLGEGCPVCGGSYKLTTDEFIKRGNEIHQGKYDYSKVEYVNCDTKVCIICPEHGEFWQVPRSHLEGYGCKKCAANLRKELYSSNTDEFIEKARKIHGDTFDYSKVHYVNAETKVCIICPKHGEFWQTPIGHINNHQGCPTCNESKLERAVRVYMDANNIKYIPQFSDTWLRCKGGKQSFDFLINDSNIFIECQGIQHFIQGKYNYVDIKKVIERDERKYNLAQEHGYIIFYYTTEKNIVYANVSPIYNNCIYTNLDVMFSDIKKVVDNRISVPDVTDKLIQALN